MNSSCYNYQRAEPKVGLQLVLGHSICHLQSVEINFGPDILLHNHFTLFPISLLGLFVVCSSESIHSGCLSYLKVQH